MPPVVSKPIKAKRWRSIPTFVNGLKREHRREAAPPTIDGDTPRRALRRHMWDTLRARGPMTAPALRGVVLGANGLDHKSTRAVNYHALALGDMLKRGFVKSSHAKIGKKRVKVYAATKPRVRIKAEPVVHPKPERAPPSSRTKLSPEYIDDIRASAAEGASFVELAELYGVSRQTIANITYGKGCYAVR